MNIELLRTLGKVKKFNEGEFICLEKETGNTAYLLLQGKAEVIFCSFEDSNHRVAALKPGAFFGEMSLLENKVRNASVQAKVDNTLVLEIEKSNFFKILQTDSQIAWNLMNTLLTRMENMMGDLRFSSFASVAGYKKNALYLQIKKLNEEQFVQIAMTDTEYAYKLLRFLSGALAEMNEDMLKEEKRKSCEDGR